ncbi:MAG: sugar ABC transporter substrate-binding protein, partial [Dehalococcoidia bacterium]|nr:sugar ABC transporter substrate-binding protein [Dehalococcoidia bacterium]
MKKGLLTAVIGIGLVLVLALALPLSSCAPGEKVYKVCITQIATHPDLDSNRQGIVDAMAE